MPPLGLALSASPVLSSSPPARSNALPIKSLSGTRQSTPVREASDDGVSTSRRVSFNSAARTPVSCSPVTAGVAKRPPAGPSAARQRVVGFDCAEAALGVAAPGLASPGKQASLLTSALSGELVRVPVDLYGTIPFSGHGRAPPAQTLQPSVDLSLLHDAQARSALFQRPLVISAYHVAARAFAGRARKNGDPVLRHCVETALICAEMGLPAELVAAALLADVLSDTPLTPAHLEEHVPHAVVDTVEKVTRLSEISQTYRDNTHTLEAQAVLDMLTTMADVGALLVKLAGRLHNMRTIEALPRCKQVRMANETLDVFSVLANRLGAWALKAELEDLAFKTLHPDEYAEVAAGIAGRAAGAAAALAAAAAQLQGALEGAGLEVVDVQGRQKSVYGVWKKARSSGGGVGGVHDLLALRVVVPHKHDCYAALRAVDALWRPLPGRCKDYVRVPKANGYQSLHTTVALAGPDGARGAGPALEVQIRTPKMHYIAEYGFAAHWRYKEQLGSEDQWLDRLVQWKKWVAAEKLGVVDGKVRPPPRAGAGGAGAADAAVAGGRDRALAALGVRAGGSGGGAAAAAELDPLLRHERFAVRDVASLPDARAAPVHILVSGPRGVRLEQLPAGTTVAQLMGGGALSAPEVAGCELAVNGEELGGSPSRVLEAGDQVTLRPRRGAAVGAGAASLGGAPAAAAAAPAAGQQQRGGGAVGPPMLHVYRAGATAPLEVALQGKLRMSTAQLRMPALAS